ncbi:hypothetical protein ACIA48_07920 [Mycobacterium sp. NPDC051804]|uniref:hypothetical protein n=1 Tax=Mycobacterium sp. NPDC051804 TaxID=3364295 RepID=UPI0037B4CF17
MARLGPRLTASAGVLAAFLLLGSSATVAFADPRGSHSDRGHSSDRGNGDGNGRGGSDRGDGNGRGGSDRGDRNGDSGKRDEGDGDSDKGGVESPEVTFGSGRIATADVGELAPSLAAGSGDSGAASRSAGSDASVFGGFGAADAPGRSGSDRAGAPNAGFNAPRVTVGNGRTPGIQKRDPEPQWRAPVSEPAPAAPPPPPPAPAPAPAPSWVNRLPAAPVLTQQMGDAPPVDWSDPLWGLAGLLLIPAAGAVLGYRQARAAHAAERLRRP